MSPELALRLMCPSEALPQNGKPPYDLVSDFSDGSQAVGREGGHSPYTTLPPAGSLVTLNRSVYPERHLFSGHQVLHAEEGGFKDRRLIYMVYSKIKTIWVDG